MLFTIIISSILGILSGLGVGGGSLLMLWLTSSCRIGISEARTINLLFFIPAASIACFFKRKALLSNARLLFPAILSGCFSAALFSILSRSWDVRYMQKAFGILLIAAAIQEFRASEFVIKK